MSVLSRDVLEDSPLADLHTIASEIGIDGFRRLRKEDLVEAILGRQGGGGVTSPDGDADEAPAPRARTRRTPRAAAGVVPSSTTGNKKGRSVPANRGRRSTAQDHVDAGDRPAQIG